MKLLFILIVVAAAALVVAADEMMRNELASQKSSSSVSRNSAAHVTFGELDPQDCTTQLADLVFVLQAQNEQLFERLTALETVVSSATNNVKAITDGLAVLTVEVDLHDANITKLNENDAAQNEKISALEATVTEPLVACESAPCENDGTCVDVNVDTLICLCRDGFFGVVCAESYSDTTFLATFDVYTLTPTNPIVFNYPVYNAGGHYDPTTGIYTVPLDGTFEFTVHIWSYNDATVAAWLTVDGTDVAYAYEQNVDSPYEGMNIAVVLQLEAGQQVWVSPNQINEMYGVSTADGLLSWFSGHLLYAVRFLIVFFSK